MQSAIFVLIASYLEQTLSTQKCSDRFMSCGQFLLFETLSDSFVWPNGEILLSPPLL